MADVSRIPVGRRGARTFRMATASIGIAALLAACGSSSSSGSSGATGSNSKTPFSIVDLEPLSGPLAPYGAAGEQASEAAVAVLNKAGGILGQKVTLDVINDGGTATQSVTALQGVLDSGTKPDLILPGDTSTEGVATIPLICQAGILSVGTPNVTALDNPAKYPCFFSTAVPEATPAAALAQYAKSHGWSDVAVLTSTDAYGTSVASALIPAMKQLGVHVDAATYDDTQINFTPTVAALQAGNPKALVFDGQGPVVSLILQARQALKWDIPTVGDLGVAASPAVTTTLLGSAALDNVQVQIYREMLYQPNPSQALKDFQSAMLAEGKIDQPLIIYSGHYDAIMLAAAAAIQAKSTDATAMEKALEDLRQPAVPRWLQLSHYSFSPSNHFPTGSSSDFTVTEPTALYNGQIGKTP